MNRYKSIILVTCFLCWYVFVQSIADAKADNLYQSVTQALKRSPQLKALNHRHKALEHDLDQSRRLRRPSIDLTVGQGLEQHSDDKTRAPGADPSDNDWDSKSDVTLKLIQKLYDGGETRSLISIQEALLDASHYRVQAISQAVALDAISAHLDVYLQRKLVELAQKNLKVHQDIYQLLSEREQAGAGDIADVTQTNARMARAKSNLFIKKGDLSRAAANYTRVIGKVPGELAHTEGPEGLPISLEDALKRTEEKNPELLSFNAGSAEVEARVRLARSPYKPNINFELGSSYNDQMEGSNSWQNTYEAMVVLRWNLYNGGQDRARLRAAQSRKHERYANHKDLLLELRERTTAAWDNYLSLQNQIAAYREATKYSRSTFEAYMNQFNISRRSLLDVLNAENDYHQAASQLLTATVNITLEAYRILNLGGALELTLLPRSMGESDELSQLSQPMFFPFAGSASEPEPPSISPDQPVEKTPPSLSIRIGPCINRSELVQAEKYLQGRRVDAHRVTGNGKVKFFRLLEGVYPPDDARIRLKTLKRFSASAFVVPQGANLALYAGSFHRPARAQRLKDRLEREQIDVKIIEKEIEMTGTMIVVQQVNPSIANAIEKHMLKKGLPLKIFNKDS